MFACDKGRTFSQKTKCSNVNENISGTAVGTIQNGLFVLFVSFYGCYFILFDVVVSVHLFFYQWRKN